MVADETPAELEARSSRHNGVRVRLSGDVETAEGLLSSDNCVDLVTRTEQADVLFCFAKTGKPIAARIADLMRDNNIAVQELEVERGRLDDVFRDITKGTQEMTGETPHV